MLLRCVWQPFELNLLQRSLAAKPLLKLLRIHRLTENKSELHFSRFNLAVIGTRDKLLRSIFKFWCGSHVRAPQFAITAHHHHGDDVAILMLDFVAIGARKVTGEHLQNQLIAWLPSYGERNQSAIGIALIAIRASEPRQFLVA